MTLGERIKSLRLTTDLSQGELEQKTGIKREYLSRLEAGKLPNPTLKTLKILAKGLKVDPAVLVTDDLKILAIIVPNEKGKRGNDL